MSNYELEFERWLNSDVLTDSEKAELSAIASNEELKELQYEYKTN